MTLPQRQPKRPQRHDNDSCDYEPCHVSGSSYGAAEIEWATQFGEIVALIPPVDAMRVRGGAA